MKKKATQSAEWGGGVERRKHGKNSVTPIHPPPAPPSPRGVGGRWPWLRHHWNVPHRSINQRKHRNIYKKKTNKHTNTRNGGLMLPGFYRVLLLLLLLLLLLRETWYIAIAPALINLQALNELIFFFAVDLFFGAGFYWFSLGWESSARSSIDQKKKGKKRKTRQCPRAGGLVCLAASAVHVDGSRSPNFHFNFSRLVTWNPKQNSKTHSNPRKPSKNP